MYYLKDLVLKNGHKIVKYNECKANAKYMSVFDYSVKYGGTYDSFRYYNNYVIEIYSKPYMDITIMFLNNGSAVAKYEDSTYTYVHLYDDMKQLAEDYYSIISDGLDGSEISHWDGNEPEMWEDNEEWRCCCIYEENTEESNFTALSELDSAWGGNIARFLESLNSVLVTSEV